MDWFKWLRRAPEPTAAPAPVRAPSGGKRPAALMEHKEQGGEIAINLPPRSRAAMMRHLVRMERLYGAIEKAHRHGDTRRAAKLSAELDRRTYALRAVGIRVRDTLEDVQRLIAEHGRPGAQ
jgi:hypothetical protein